MNRPPYSKLMMMILIGRNCVEDRFAWRGGEEGNGDTTMFVNESFDGFKWKAGEFAVLI